jgi:hypothetical protein
MTMQALRLRGVQEAKELRNAAGDMGALSRLAQPVQDAQPAFTQQRADAMRAYQRPVLQARWQSDLEDQRQTRALNQRNADFNREQSLDQSIRSWASLGMGRDAQKFNQGMAQKQFGLQQGQFNLNAQNQAFNQAMMQNGLGKNGSGSGGSGMQSSDKGMLEQANKQYAQATGELENALKMRANSKQWKTLPPAERDRLEGKIANLQGAQRYFQGQVRQYTDRMQEATSAAPASRQQALNGVRESVPSVAEVSKSGGYGQWVQDPNTGMYKKNPNPPAGQIDPSMYQMSQSAGAMSGPQPGGLADMASRPTGSIPSNPRIDEMNERLQAMIQAGRGDTENARRLQNNITRKQEIAVRNANKQQAAQQRLDKAIADSKINSIGTRQMMINGVVVPRRGEPGYQQKDLNVNGTIVPRGSELQAQMEQGAAEEAQLPTSAQNAQTAEKPSNRQIATDASKLLGSNNSIVANEAIQNVAESVRKGEMRKSDALDTMLKSLGMDHKKAYHSFGTSAQSPFTPQGLRVDDVKRIAADLGMNTEGMRFAGGARTPWDDPKVGVDLQDLVNAAMIAANRAGKKISRTEAEDRIFKHALRLNADTAYDQILPVTAEQFTGRGLPPAMGTQRR